jgi:hypothetical protein
MAALAARLRSALSLPNEERNAHPHLSPVALLLLVLALGGLGLAVVGRTPTAPERPLPAPIEPEAARLPRGELPIIGDPIRDLTIWYAQRVSDANRAAVENLRGRFLAPVDPLADQATTDLYGKMLVLTIPLLTMGGLLLGYLIIAERGRPYDVTSSQAGASASWTPRSSADREAGRSLWSDSSTSSSASSPKPRCRCGAPRMSYATRLPERSWPTAVMSSVFSGFSGTAPRPLR